MTVEKGMGQWWPTSLWGTQEILVRVPASSSRIGGKQFPGLLGEGSLCLYIRKALTHATGLVNSDPRLSTIRGAFQTGQSVGAPASLPCPIKGASGSSRGLALAYLMVTRRPAWRPLEH